MTPDMPLVSIATSQSTIRRIWSLLASHFIHGGSDTEETAPIGDREFRILMGIVVLATVAFGVIMNGWSR
jgi:hypothetical protein